MKILAVDSSTKTAAAALLEDRTLLAESSVRTETHSAVLLPMIESLTRAAGVEIRDVDLLAVTGGPGSFTGVRIGVSTVKGLAFADRIPCLGVSSLEALAYNFAGIAGLVVPVLDARRGTVFTAVFRTGDDGEVTRLTEDGQLPVDELMERLSTYGGERVYFTGDAADAALAHPGKPAGAHGTPEKLKRQSAYGAGLLAYSVFTSPNADRAAMTDAVLQPVYLKKSQAERERDERLAKDQNH